MPGPELLEEHETTSAVPALAGSGRRIDMAFLGAEIVFVGIAAAVGAILQHHGVRILIAMPPIAANFLPHVGPGTALAFAVAVLVVWRGFDYARTARWGLLLGVGYVAAAAWTFGLALIDGWQRGIAGRLTTPDEFVVAAGRITNIPHMISTFSKHIVAGPPNGGWPTHIAGHPPGAFLIFIALDRLGLHGGGWAGVACILIGALAPVCIVVTIRALGGDALARTALPFLVLFPGAIWVGVSADGMFMGVAATGIALLALPGWWRAAFGGLLLGYTLYLSYGLVLYGLLALAVLWFKPASRLRSLIAGLTGASAVALAFSLAGFWWPTGYRLVVVRYYQGYGTPRPYAYWVWGDLAALAICAGPVLWPALRRAVLGLPSALRAARAPRPVEARTLLTWTPLLALVGVLGADLSGLSKSEVERIWLPFAIWLVVAAPLLPPTRHRFWLILQAVAALAINSLLLTSW